MVFVAWLGWRPPARPTVAAPVSVVSHAPPAAGRLTPEQIAALRPTIVIGRGISGLYARPTVAAAERAQVEAVLAPTGQTLWVGREEDLDAVTALSGSGPAYVFYFVEAMIAAAQQMGLSAE